MLTITVDVAILVCRRPAMIAHIFQDEPGAWNSQKNIPILLRGHEDSCIAHELARFAVRPSASTGWQTLEAYSLRNGSQIAQCSEVRIRSAV